MEGFNSLKVGDQVTATYFAAVAVNLHRHPAPAAAPVPTTQRKERTAGIGDEERADVHGDGPDRYRSEGAFGYCQRATGTCRPARAA